MYLPINKEELLLYLTDKMQSAVQLGWILLVIGIICILVGFIYWTINDTSILPIILIPAGIAAFCIGLFSLTTGSNMLDLIQINPDYAIFKYLEDY